MYSGPLMLISGLLVLRFFLIESAVVGFRSLDFTRVCMFFGLCFSMKDLAPVDF